MIEQLLRRSLRGDIPIALLLTGILAGLFALQFTAREEEPQIVVPMVSVGVTATGLSARQVERQVTIPLENLLSQIPGVEHVYSTSNNSRAEVTLRFYVGQDREDSLLNTYNKLTSNEHRIPAVVDSWSVNPVEVDDVPILLIGLWSDDPARYDDTSLRRIADEIVPHLQSIEHTSEVMITGGRQRQISIDLDPEAMTARMTTVADIASAINVSNLLAPAGDANFADQRSILESGDYFRSVRELADSLVSVVDGIPVKLRDVARVRDTFEEPASYQWLEFGQAHPRGRSDTPGPMVTISIAKQRGTNAVAVAEAVHDRLESLRASIIPEGVHVETLRDYGETADDKVNNLVGSLAFAVLTVVVFLGLFLDWRAALVVAIAVPLCYGFTLLLDYLLGYTINRVTLFALILSLGLLVDDPITGVDNIERFLREKSGALNDRVVDAMSEIKVALVVSTITIVVAFLPLAFITGMMGPYMAPMAFNVPVSVIMSTIIAFLVTPWLASRLLKPAVQSGEPTSLGFYRRILEPVIQSRQRASRVLWVVLVLFGASAMLPLLREVPLKLLPFDNKNEIQVLIDMPEGSTLESTAAEASRLSSLVRTLQEVAAVGVYVGQPSPNDFNGMVRQYHRRQAPYLADLRVTLAPRSQRVHSSHALVLRLREALRDHDSPALIRVIEAPPGPPVMDTLVAEIYGSPLTPYDSMVEGARRLEDRLQQEPHVVQVDSTIQAPQQLMRFITDKEKAALSGISVEDINRLLQAANSGVIAGHLNFPREAHPLPVVLRLTGADRARPADLLRLQVSSRQELRKLTRDNGLDQEAQPLVALAELGEFESLNVDQAIYHKDLRPVVYVTADLSGRTPAEVIADVHSDYQAEGESAPAPDASPWDKRTYVNNGGGIAWDLPEGVDLTWSGEGEWRITLRVFRDMGLGFLFALIAIFAVLSLQTGSVRLALIIMSAIPLTIIGIMPGFFLLNQVGERTIGGAPDPVLFTATAMIGMIALAGIVVRNSLILVEFIEQARQRGVEFKEALYSSGAYRMRPVLLTAGTTLLGNLVITLDPVFNGLALAIIFGIIASTLFTLVVVPVVYYLVFDPAHHPEGDRYE